MTQEKAEIVVGVPTIETTQGQTAIQRAAVTPMELLQVAVSQGADIDKLAKLMDLQERWEKNEARKAFVQAMNQFKSDLPDILKNRHVRFQTSKGVTEYDHATIDQVCDALIPALSKYNLHHRWKVAQDNGKIRVTCVITHEMGHSEETTMEASPDDSGGKNAIQAISSSTTYLERYTFLAGTGTAAKGTDTDGIIAEPMPGEDQALAAIAEAPDTSGLAHVFKEATSKAMLAKNGPAIIRLTEARDKRRKELTAEEPA